MFVFGEKTASASLGHSGGENLWRQPLDWLWEKKYWIFDSFRDISRHKKSHRIVHTAIRFCVILTDGRMRYIAQDNQAWYNKSKRLELEYL